MQEQTKEQPSIKVTERRLTLEDGVTTGAFIDADGRLHAIWASFSPKQWAEWKPYIDNWLIYGTFIPPALEWVEVVPDLIWTCEKAKKWTLRKVSHGWSVYFGIEHLYTALELEGAKEFVLFNLQSQTLATKPCGTRLTTEESHQ